jgi:hypothetical protein
MTIRSMLKRLHPVYWLPMPDEWRLEWHLKRAYRMYSRDLRRARRKGVSREEREEIEMGWQVETEEMGEELASLRTSRLLRTARRLHVPYPPPWPRDNEFWQRGHMTGSWYLTTAGINKVRAEIRGEQKARQELRGHWIAWVAAISGLVGMLTGLFAVLGS